MVHHLTLAVLPADLRDELEALDAAAPGPGFECAGGLGGISLSKVQYLGGSLLGGDFPDGLGHAVEPDVVAVLQIHYSTVNGWTLDRTAVELKIDATAKEFGTIAVANAAWLIDDAFLIEAGDPDAVYWHAFEPELWTRGKRVWITGVLPHMHAFGSKFLVRIIRANGERECLLEIPAWDFGWTQTYWLENAVTLDKGDQLYVECHFDNSAANQPDGATPKDIGWGNNNQDMCAAFVTFAKEQP
jgi:hypothetical protein